MADSIERIAGEIDARSGNANGITPAELMGWATRLRALSPAGGGGLAEAERRSMEQRAEAWDAVVSVLFELRPDWTCGQGTGIDLAVAAIRGLAASPQQEPGAACPHIVQSKEGTAYCLLAESAGASGGGVCEAHGKAATESLVKYACGCSVHESSDGRNTIATSGQTLAGAGGDSEVLRDQALMLREMASRRRVCGNSPGEVFDLEMIARSLDRLAATSAGTTGDDSEDAARYRWLRTCGVADDRAIHTRDYSELLSESALDAAIDARRAREAG